MREWLLLLYSIPREPTAPRVAVWRKLKRLGALLLADAAWVLPAREATREQLRWLAAESRVYDALYAYCQQIGGSGRRESTGDDA